MKISKAEWNNYIKTMSQLSDKASKEFSDWANRNGGWEGIDRQLLAEAAWSIASKYAEGSSALAAEMYDSIAQAEKKKVPTAELSADVEFGQLAKAINGALKHSTNDDFISSPVGRAVKQAGADTMLKNASRDGAEFAWIPAGDTCPFCLVLASNGWQKASKKTTNGNHAEHIHTHCDCQFAIRFNKNTKVEGYDPEVYQKMYYDAEGKNSKEKINSLRKMYNTSKKFTDKNKKENEYKGLNFDLQLFAEKLSGQGEIQLRKGIKNLQKKIDEHQVYLNDPKIEWEEWDSFSEERKQRELRHWEIEIKAFNEGIENRIEELKKRGLWNE